MNQNGITSLPGEIVNGIVGIVSALIGWLVHKWFGK
jgi:hypothetical protein